jgi:hypothetical protein
MIVRMARALGMIAIVATISFAPACTVSPQPLPPPIDVGIDQSRIALRIEGTTPHLVGSPGAITITPADAEATVDFVNLSHVGPTSAALAARDGSFDLPVSIAPTQTGRLTATARSARSAPVDLYFSDTGDGLTFGPPRPPLTDCLLIEPTLVDFGSVSVGSAPLRRDVVVTNRCSEAVALVEVALRPELPPLSVASTPTDPLASQASATVTVTFDPRAAGTVRSNVAFRIDSPTAGTRAVIVTGEAR